VIGAVGRRPFFFRDTSALYYWGRARPAVGGEPDQVSTWAGILGKPARVIFVLAPDAG